MELSGIEWNPDFHGIEKFQFLLPVESRKLEPHFQLKSNFPPLLAFYQTILTLSPREKMRFREEWVFLIFFTIIRASSLF